MTPYIGQILQVGFSFPPQGWALCNGQLLSIAENTALFSLIGTLYGGDGQTTFGLPNLQGRIGINQGQGPGLSNYTIGQTGGEVAHTLISTELPQHNHVMIASGGVGSSSSPNNAFPAVSSNNDLYAESNDGSFLAPNAVTPSGGSQSHDNMQPYLVTSFIIALEGIYPSFS